MTAKHGGRGACVYMGIASDTAAAERLPVSSKWMANFAAKFDECTAFGDGNAHYTMGLPDGQGSVEGFWDAGTAQTYTANQDGLARRSYFYPTTASTAGPYWYGTFFWTFEVEAEVGATVKYKATFAPATDYVKIGS